MSSIKDEMPARSVVELGRLNGGRKTRSLKENLRLEKQGIKNFLKECVSVLDVKRLKKSDSSIRIVLEHPVLAPIVRNA